MIKNNQTNYSEEKNNVIEMIWWKFKFKPSETRKNCNQNHQKTWEGCRRNQSESEHDFCKRVVIRQGDVRKKIQYQVWEQGKV